MGTTDIAVANEGGPEQQEIAPSGKWGVPFTQFVLPHGRRREITIYLPTEVGAKAEKILNAGLRLEAEILTTGGVSLTIGGRDEDLAVELCPNGPEVLNACTKLISEFNLDQYMRAEHGGGVTLVCPGDMQVEAYPLLDISDFQTPPQIGHIVVLNFTSHHEDVAGEVRKYRIVDIEHAVFEDDEEQPSTVLHLKRASELEADHDARQAECA